MLNASTSSLSCLARPCVATVHPFCFAIANQIINTFLESFTDVFCFDFVFVIDKTSMSHVVFLIKSIVQGSTDTAEDICRHKLVPSSNNCLHVALLSKRNIRMVEFLVKSFPSLQNKTNKKKHTPLHTAVLLHDRHETFYCGI